MRILPDEPVPRRLASLLIGHEATSVPKSGWAGIKNLGSLHATAIQRCLGTCSTLQASVAWPFRTSLAAAPLFSTPLSVAAQGMGELLRQAATQPPPQTCKIPSVEEELLCGKLTVFENRRTRSGRQIAPNVVILSL